MEHLLIKTTMGAVRRFGLRVLMSQYAGACVTKLSVICLGHSANVLFFIITTSHKGEFHFVGFSLRDYVLTLRRVCEGCEQTHHYNPVKNYFWYSSSK